MSDIQKERDRIRRNYEGFIYVVEFSTGVVKVGRTNDLNKRLVNHSKSGLSHGLSVSRTWGSEPHARYGDNEVKLIEFCSDRWPIAGGREYFRGADFGEVVSFAEGLPKARLSDADIDAIREGPTSTSSLVDAFERAMEKLDEDTSGHEGEGHGCPWYAQFTKSRAWFQSEYPEGGWAPVHVGRHAWAALPNKHKAATLDIFFNEYWISLHEEEEEDRKWRESGGYEANLAELRAIWAGLRDGDDRS